MLAIAGVHPVFRYKQRQNEIVTLNCVSRTRFRKAGERRKRRGRWINLLIQLTGTLDKLVAAKQQRLARTAAHDQSDASDTSLTTPGVSVCILFVVPVRLLLIDLVTRMQVCVCIREATSAPRESPRRSFTTVWSVDCSVNETVREVVVSSWCRQKIPYDSKGGKKRARVLWLDWKLNLGVGIDIPSRSRLCGPDLQTLQQLRSSMDFRGRDRFWHSGDFRHRFERRTYIGGLIAPDSKQ